MITIHDDMEQGSDEWIAARCGMLTASEFGLIVTPTLKFASNEKERTHLFELAAQRINRFVEPHYISDDMLRGRGEEILARDLYSQRCAPVRQVGFIVNDNLGFPIGCSPDGLVEDDPEGPGMIEAKGRRQKFQIQTIIEQAVPTDFTLQVQGQLLVSGRAWCDFISYSGGSPMTIIRARPDPKVQAVLAEAATAFEERLQAALDKYGERLADPALRLFPTERVIEQEIIV